MSKQPKNLSDAIAKWTVILAENYRQEIKPTLLEIWFQALKDLTVPVFESACLKHMQTVRYFPTVADIRIAAGTVPQSKAAEDLAEAEAAWLSVLKYANKWHPDTDPPRSRTLTRSEARSLAFAGGIYRLWELQDDGGTELAFMRKAFIESYLRRDAVDIAVDKANQRQIGSGMKSIKEIIGQMPGEIPEEPKQ